MFIMPNSINNFSELTNYFINHGSKTVFKKGQLLIRREDNSPWMYYIESGVVKLNFTNPEGETRTLGFNTPNMVSYQNNKFRTLPEFELEYEAISEVVARRVSREDFEAELNKNPALLKDWSARIMARGELLLERILYSGERNPRRRIVAWLRAVCHYYGQPQPDGSIVVTMPLTQEVIASFVGLSRESTNRVISELKTLGLLRIKRHIITVVDPDKISDLK